MVELKQLLNYTNELLRITDFRDYCPNGLQVEGKPEVRRIVSGVSASQALIDEAVNCGADAILVHHGFFWKGESPCVVGSKRRRIATLLKNELNLLAYHLPLDAHPEFGNNVQLAKRLGIVVDGRLTGDADLVCTGVLPEPQSAEQFAESIEKALGRVPLVVNARRALIKRIAWCTGGAQSYIKDAVDAGVDAYLTGESSEHNFHTANEEQIDFFAAGHHATERYGVQALGDHLAERFGVEHVYVEIPNPI